MSARRRAGVEPVSSAALRVSRSDQALDGGEMLLGQGLCGSHEGGLAAVLHGSQHGVQRDHGLPASDLAHQQSLHRSLLGQIQIDRLNRAKLIGGGREGELLRQPAGAQRRRILQRDRTAMGTPRGAPAQEHQLGQQQLLEGQPPAAGLQVTGQPREVHGRQRRGSIGQALAHARRGREEIADVAERMPGSLHQREDLRGGDTVGGRIVRDRAIGAGRLGHLAGNLRGRGMMGHPKAATPVGLAVQQQAGARLVALDQPGLVEEGGPHRCARVEDDRLDQRAHPAPTNRARGYAAHLHCDRGLLAARERGDRARLATVGRDVLEQIADGLEA